MRFAFTDDQLALRDAVRDLLADRCPPAVVHAAWASSTGLNPGLWRALGEMGVLGMLVPEALGGLGMTMTDAVLVVEEAGYAGLPDPLIEHAIVGLPLVADELASEELAALMAGESVLTVGGFNPTVPFGAVANCVAWPDGSLTRGAVIGEAVATVDGARRLVVGSMVGATGVGAGTSDSVAGALAGLLAGERGVVASAALLIGAARRCLDVTVGYVTQRQQFGVPVGSFQGLKHQLATALMELEFARPAVYRAAVSLAGAAPGTASTDGVAATLARDTSMAKAMASDAARLVARTCLQAHGAIGYTVEYDLHLWFKRIHALAADWGSAAGHRQRVGVALHLV